MTACPYCTRKDSHRHSVVIDSGRVLVDGLLLDAPPPVTPGEPAKHPRQVAAEAALKVDCPKCGAKVGIWCPVQGWRTAICDERFALVGMKEDGTPGEPGGTCGTCGGTGNSDSSPMIPCPACRPSPPRSPEEGPATQASQDTREWVARMTASLPRSPEAKPPKCECDKHETTCPRSADYLVTRAGKRLAVCDRCTLTGDGTDDRDLNPDCSKHRPAGSPEAKACFEWCGAHAPPPPESTVVTRIFGDGDRFFCTPACRDAGKALNPRAAK